MPNNPEATGGRFDTIRLLADPVYGYVEITRGSAEVPGEEDLLDNPWLQRLRFIHQLQASWWVFPSAEHSRFAHLLGAMHLAGRFARQVDVSLRREFSDVPSAPVVEETLRLAGLLHDVGHGPFGHFFDRQVLKRWNIDHEDIGRHLVLHVLGQQIRALTSSPSGNFLPGESVDPAWVAWVMAPAAIPGYSPPEWLAALKPILCGPATVDNLDYVVRDAYMCGVKIAVDVDRLIHYSFVKDGTVVLHDHAVPSLQSFLHSRLQLYTSIYNHRTSKRFELSMREIFADSFSLLGMGNPLEQMDEYLWLTDWSFMEAVKGWIRHPQDAEQRRLGEAWARIMARDAPWRLAFETLLRSDVELGEFETALRRAVGEELRIVVDTSNIAVVSQNPMRSDGFIGIYDPLAHRVSPTSTSDLLAQLPQHGQQLRVFTDDRLRIPELGQAARQVLEQMIKGQRVPA